MAPFARRFAMQPANYLKWVLEELVWTSFADTIMVELKLLKRDGVV